MDQTSKLTIIKRTKGSKGAMRRLRKEGFLPGSISQKGKDAVSFSMKYDEFRKAFNTLGMTGIYTLQGEKKKAHTAMIREIQNVPGSYDFLHITFQAVSLTEETTADIHLHIKGRDEVTHNGYELQQQLESVHLKGLPGDFPAAIDIDVSNMQPGDQVTVAEVELPESLTCLTEPDRLIVSVHHPKVKAEAAEGTEETTDAASAPAETGEAAAEPAKEE